MARSLLVAPAAEDVGLARTCLGLLRALERIGVRVDYVKPVAQPGADGTPDRSVARVAAVTTLRPPEPLSTAELERQLGEGERNIIREKIVAAWAPIYHRSERCRRGRGTQGGTVPAVRPRRKAASPTRVTRPRVHKPCRGSIRIWLTGSK